MSECINWKSVIPNFQQGDIITPFESEFQRRRNNDFILGGGINHYDLAETYASVRRKDSKKVGVYNQKGEQILPEEFENCKLVIYNSGDFYLTAMKVQKEGLYGLYNEKGHEIVPTQFIDIDIKDNFVVVMDENKLYGAYLSCGKKIINCEYDSIEVHGNLDEGFGYAIISKKGLFGVKLETGIEVVPIKFKSIKKVYNGYVVYADSTEEYPVKGWYSRDGKSSIPCAFKKLEFQDETIRVKTPNDLIGIYSFRGKELVPPKFKSIYYLGDYFVGLIAKDLSVYNLSGKCLYSTKE